MGLGQLYISLETSVLCEDWIYRGKIRKKKHARNFAPPLSHQRDSQVVVPLQVIR